MCKGECKGRTELIQKPRISVSMSRKINLGNYESQDIFVSLACDSNDLNSIEVEAYLDQVEKILNEKVNCVIKSLKD